LFSLTGVSGRTIVDIEQGKADPSIKRLYLIYFRLKVNPKIFFISKEELD